MIDYLSALAHNVANPSSDVRPSLKPLFGDRGVDAFNAALDEPAIHEETTNIESPASWHQSSLPDREQPNHWPISERTREAELANRVTSSEQQIGVAFQSLFATDPRLAVHHGTQSVQVPPRPEPLSSNTRSDRSSFRPGHPSVEQPTLDLQRSKSAPAEQQGPLSDTPDRSADSRSTRDSALPVYRSQFAERIKDIVPLSVTKIGPVHSIRSQPVNSSIVQHVTETIVHVTVGRVEVRATVGQQRPVAVREPSSRHSGQSLDDYLRGGTSGRSS